MPGLVSTLLNQAYSMPSRLVQTFLHVTEQVWQPMHLSRFRTIPICARIFMFRSPWCVRRRRVRRSVRRRVEPVHVLHLAHDDELVAVGTHRAVVVEAVRLLRVAADHVRRLDHGARHRVVDAAADAGDLRARHVDDLLLGVVHHAPCPGARAGDHRARRDARR